MSLLEEFIPEATKTSVSLEASFPSAQLTRLELLHALKTHLHETHGIARENARYLNELAPGLLNDRLILEQFTEVPSQHFYREALEYLDEAIEETQKETYAAYRALVEKQLSMLDALQKDKDATIQSLSEKATEIATTYRDLFEGMDACDDFVFPSDKGFVSIRDNTLAELSSRVLMAPSTLKEETRAFIKAVALLHTLTGEEALNAFIIGYLHESAFDKLFTLRPTDVRSYTLKELRPFTDADAICSYVEAAFTYLEEQRALLESLLVEVEKDTLRAGFETQVKWQEAQRYVVHLYASLESLPAFYEALHNCYAFLNTVFHFAKKVTRR